MYRKSGKIVFSVLIFSAIAQYGWIASTAAENNYSNQLLKVNLDKASDNNVNLTVYTSKPYKIKLTPIKRSNNEYVIFLPETYHSITNKPETDSGAVKDVDIKLVPYIDSDSSNGYTKITVKTNGENVKLNLDEKSASPQADVEDELNKLVQSNIKKEKIEQRSHELVQLKSNPIKRSSKPDSVKVSEKAVNKKIATRNKIIISDTKDGKVLEKIEIRDSGAVQETEKAKPVEPVLAETENQTVPLQAQDSIVAESPANPEIYNDMSETIQQVEGLNQPEKKKENRLLAIVCKAALLIISSIILLAVLGRLFKPRKSKKIFADVEEYLEEQEQVQAQDDVSEQQEFEQEQAIQQGLQQAVRQAISRPQLPVRPQQIQPQINNQPPVQNNQRTAPPANQDVAGKDQFKERVQKTSVRTGMTKPPQQPVQPVFEPEVIEGVELENQKGIYLVQLEDKKALIGIVGSEIFVLNKFEKPVKPELSVRKTESSDGKDVLYVQVDKWNGLVSSGRNKMKLELVF